MDPFFLLTFTFVLLLVLLVGGFVLVWPLSRQLAAYLEMQLEKRRDSPEAAARLERLQHELHRLSAQVELLAERQEFTEELLAEKPDARRLGGGPPAGTGEHAP